MLITDVQVHDIQKKQAPAVLEGSRFFMLFFIAGNGTLHTEEGKLAVSNGQCICFPHAGTISAQGNMMLVQIVFSVENPQLKRLLQSVSPLLPIQHFCARKIILNMIWESTRKPPYWEDAANLNLMRLLFAAVAEQNGQQDSTSERSQREAFVDPVLQQSVHYMDEHLADDDVLDRVCDVANRNQTQLNYLFKKHTGLTVLQWLNERRLQKSKELLCFSNYTITEIAEITGFKSIHYFSRYFKKKEMVNPQKFKETLLSVNLL